MATILCIDDDESISLLLAQTLKQAGHEPLSAANVPDALTILARGSVDLIISDYRMPGNTGDRKSVV